MAAVALHGKSSSPWQSFDLREGVETPELRLEIEQTISVRGRISHRGRGVPGARVIGSPAGTRFLPRSSEALTATDGGFELDLPESTQGIDMLVVAPGFGIRMARIPVPAAESGHGSLDLDLEAESGRLLLHLLKPFDPYVIRHGGGEWPLDSLRRIARNAGLLEAGGQGGWAIRNVPLGAYSFCHLPVATEDDCAHGTLVQRDELTLIAPRPPEIPQSAQEAVE